MDWRAETGMIALTICQPYAELIMRLEKPVENRTWYTSYRGPLVIHAGKGRKWLKTFDGTLPDPMEFGAAIGMCNLVACLAFDDRKNWPTGLRRFRLHHDCSGPWCLMLRDIRRLGMSIPCRGQLGLWTIPADIAAQVRVVRPG